MFLYWKVRRSRGPQVAYRLSRVRKHKEEVWKKPERSGAVLSSMMAGEQKYDVDEEVKN